METFEAVKKALVGVAPKNAVITPESDLLYDLGLDSLSMVMLGMAMEEAFGLDQVEPPEGQNSIWNPYIHSRHRLRSDGEPAEYKIANFVAYVDELRQKPKTRAHKRRRFLF